MEHNKSKANSSVDFFHKQTASIGSVDSLQDHSSIIAVYPEHTTESLQNKFNKNRVPFWLNTVATVVYAAYTSISYVSDSYEFQRVMDYIQLAFVLAYVVLAILKKRLSVF